MDRPADDKRSSGTETRSNIDHPPSPPPPPHAAAAAAADGPSCTDYDRAVRMCVVDLLSTESANVTVLFCSTKTNSRNRNAAGGRPACCEASNGNRRSVQPMQVRGLCTERTSADDEKYKQQQSQPFRREYVTVEYQYKSRIISSFPVTLSEWWLS